MGNKVRVEERVEESIFRMIHCIECGAYVWRAEDVCSEVGSLSGLRWFEIGVFRDGKPSVSVGW